MTVYLKYFFDVRFPGWSVGSIQQNENVFQSGPGRPDMLQTTVLHQTPVPAVHSQGEHRPSGYGPLLILTPSFEYRDFLIPPALSKDYAPTENHF